MEIVAEILARLAAGRPVWAYGSRAKRTGVKMYSDLDLIVGGRLLGGGEAWGLVEAFDESRLPFRVHLQHIEEISGEFRKRIAGDLVVVQPPE
jgi:hypothetical protein